MVEDKFKLPRSSYEEICKIIRAYGRLQEPASLEEVAKVSVINKTVISANNAFLANIELIEGGKSKSATLIGNDLAKTLEHDQFDQMQEIWARVIRNNGFLEKMAGAVKIRGKMESSALESHIAYSAGEAKSKAVKTGARAVIDILLAAGVVREQDGQLVASEGNTPTEGTTKFSPESSTACTPVLQTIEKPYGGEAKGASLHIELRIEVKPSELDGLGVKITQLLEELNRSFQAGDEEDANDS